MLLKLGDELGFHVQTLQHVLEGYKVAKEIAEHKTGGSTFADWWAYKLEAYDAIPYNAAIIQAQGVSYRSTPTMMSMPEGSTSKLQNHEVRRPHRRAGAENRDPQPGDTARHRQAHGLHRRRQGCRFVIFSAHPFSVYTRSRRRSSKAKSTLTGKVDLEQREALKREKAELIKREREQRGGPRQRPGQEKPDEPQPRPTEITEPMR